MEDSKTSWDGAGELWGVDDDERAMSRGVEE
jgi:hypothetical protein